jgi:phenylalanyl-tRNA synthetase beta chain
MKFSEQWLREWCNPPIGVEDIVRTLNSLGLEVDSVEPVAPPFSGVIVAQIKTVQPHPDADRLRVCRVYNGKSELQIVSGAPNVHEGMKVSLAPVGARLPNGMEIKQSKLRGVESFGMLCSEAELGLAEKAEGLMELPKDAPLGSDIREYLKLDDKLLEVDLTPNRGDCLSVKGVGRELALATGIAWQERWPAPVAAATKSEFPVAIKVTQACPRYVGRVIEGINTNARSPLWLVEKLRRGGIRSIHPVVDITNYVMLEIGQPMHAFDLDKLKGGIVVRYANSGEKIRLLDGNETSLDAETLVIADANGACALAGIMGGSESAVNENSQRIFLESAFFAPAAIQRKARSYGLHTDSSHRFERGVAPDLQRHAIERATALIQEIAGGKPGPIIEAADETTLPQKKAILLRREQIKRILGTKLEDDLVEKILTGLGAAVEAISEGWKVAPPAFRFDLSIEVDLIEELARIHGYERLPRTVPAHHPEKLASSEGAVSIEALSDMLIQQGYHEVICYSFVDPKLQALLEPERAACVLSNPISAEMAEMRTSLLPSLLTALKYNLNRQQKQLQIFEIGSKYLLQSAEIKEEMLIAGLRYGPQAQEHWDKKLGLADYYDIKGDVERLVASTGLSVRFEPMTHSALHPGRTAAVYLDDDCIGWVGEIHPGIMQALGLGEGPAVNVFEMRLDFLLRKRVPSYQPISRYPGIRRDLALVVDQSITWAQFEACLLSAAPSYLSEVKLFDVYTGKGVISGRKSFAIGLILQEISRTLTDSEIESAIERILQTLNQNLGATLRE